MSDESIVLLGEVENVGHSVWTEIVRHECFDTLDGLEGFCAKIDKLKETALEYYESKKRDKNEE